MSRKEALQSLLAKVEAGASGSVISDAFGPFGPPESGVPWLAFNAFHGSLDAAKALHEAVLPGWEYGYDGSIAWVKMPGLRTSYRHDAMNGHTARAWLIAIIKALIAQEETA